MNLISDFEAHKRDEEFDREDAKHRAPVTHAQRVSFADAMMRPVVDEDCEFCNGTGRIKSTPGPGGVITTVECSCGYSEP